MSPTAPPAPRRAPGSVPRISPIELRASLEGASPPPLLLDVRPTSHRQFGHLPGDLSVPLDELADRLGELPAGRPLVVYGHSGGSGAEAVELLISAGRQGVALLEGGIDGYAKWADPRIARYWEPLEGAPISGAVVTVTAGPSSYAQKATTGSSGGFVLWLANGTYSLTITASGHPTQTVTVSVAGAVKLITIPMASPRPPGGAPLYALGIGPGAGPAPASGGPVASPRVGPAA